MGIHNSQLITHNSSFNAFEPPLDFLTGAERHDNVFTKGIACGCDPRFFDQTDLTSISRQTIEIGAMERSECLESIEGAGSLEDLGIKGEGGVGGEAPRTTTVVFFGRSSMRCAVGAEKEPGITTDRRRNQSLTVGLSFQDR